MKTGGIGSIYNPKYKDRKTGEKKTSAVFWIRFGCRRTCGKTDCSGLHRESSHSDIRRGAEKLLRRRLGEVGLGRLITPDVERTSFGDLAAMLETDYQVNGRRSLKRAKISLAHLRGFFASCRALAVTTDRINEYIAARQAQKAAPATIANELAALRRAFTLALQAGKVAQRPYIPSIEVHNTRTGFFEESEFRGVLAHLPADLRPVVEFAYLTGWRKREILTLQWRNVDFQAGEVRLEPGTTKNDEGRTFPFSALPALGDLLRRQRERTTVVEKATEQIVPHVFHRSGGRPILDLRVAWENACDEAGVPGRLVHDFRRTAVRNLERAAVPRSVAMKLTGHKTESVYRRYAIVSPADLRAGVEKLARLHEQLQAEPPSSGRVVSLKGKVRAK